MEGILKYASRRARRLEQALVACTKELSKRMWWNKNNEEQKWNLSRTKGNQICQNFDSKDIKIKILIPKTLDYRFRLWLAGLPVSEPLIQPCQPCNIEDNSNIQNTNYTPFLHELLYNILTSLFI
jgi:hypothetical protein